MRIIESLDRFIEKLFGSRRRRRPAPMPERRPLSDRIIAHECGHACVAWLSAAVLSVDAVVFHPEGGATTHACFNAKHPDYRIDNLVYTLGGLAGEMLVHRRAHTSGMGGEAEADLPKALRLAEALLTVTTPTQLEARWRGGLAEPSLDVAAMFVRRPPPDVAATLNLAYRRAKHLLSRNRAGFDRLRRAADGRRDLSDEDIAAQFGPRLWAQRR